MDRISKGKIKKEKIELIEPGPPLFPVSIISADLAEGPISSHKINGFEVGSVTQGSVLLSIGDENLGLKEGDAYFVNAQVSHSFKSAGKAPCSLRRLIFSPSLVGGLVNSVFYQKYCQPLVTGNDLSFMLFQKESVWQQEAIQTIERTWQTLSRAYEEYELETRYLLSHLLSLVCTHKPLVQNPPPKKASRNADRIGLMLRYIEAHYMETITINEIADAAMISHSECLRCFHDTVGSTPLHCLRAYRIEKACGLLVHSDRPIAEVAVLCGFEDLSYFSKVFKAEKGFTPSECRRNGGNGGTKA